MRETTSRSHPAPLVSSGADGRLRPNLDPAQLPELEPGTHTVALGSGRTAELLVPGTRPGGRWPLAVMLHGAGGRPGHMIPMLFATAQHYGFLVLAPQSQGATWDVVRGGYGPDVLCIEEALEWVAARFAVDAARLAIGGFSDGGSYALSLGLTNGDLFGDVLAFSPGFAAPASAEGRPRVFIPHGLHDEVLPIERCGRPLAQNLRRAGYEVDYREFDGGHLVPRDMVDAAAARSFGRPDSAGG